MLAEEADSSLGKESARHLLPSSDRSEIIAWQSETSHALMRLFKWGKLSFHGLKDIRPCLIPLEKGGILGMGNCWISAAVWRSPEAQPNMTARMRS